ncbi:hypothetical protein [Shewanella sp. S1-58-MNA-CIBAN-0166]|uniref:hypothetical protein n=1 Tax=Shewanella sp. S1-58-MNA-CIBAN-0166 TaxID=3140467 RepID=UPI003324B27C
MYNYVILVVVYNKILSESKTLNALLKSGFDFSGSKIIVWNNGPCSIDFNKECFEFKSDCEVEFFETLDNSALSVIYNHAINFNNADKYIFLDDDSDLSVDYFESLKYVDSKSVGVPIIKTYNYIVSPTIDNLDLTPNIIINNYSSVMGIASGLVVGRSVVNRFRGQFNSVFDERFYLYGVDTSFFFRLCNLKVETPLCILNGFSHSLSRLESNGYSTFKLKERSYDIGLQLRHYYPFLNAIIKLFSFVIKDILKLIISRKRTYQFQYVCLAFVTGKHYKNKR